MSKSLAERAKEIIGGYVPLSDWVLNTKDDKEMHAAISVIADQAQALTEAEGKLKAVEDSIEGYNFEYGARYKDGTYHEGELNLANEIRKAIE